MLSRLFVALLLAAFGLLTGCGEQKAQSRPAPKAAAAEETTPDTSADDEDQLGSAADDDDDASSDDEEDDDEDSEEDDDDEDDSSAGNGDLISNLLAMLTGGGLAGLDPSALQSLGLDTTQLTTLLSGGGLGNLQSLLSGLQSSQLQGLQTLLNNNAN